MSIRSSGVACHPGTYTDGSHSCALHACHGNFLGLVFASSLSPVVSLGHHGYNLAADASCSPDQCNLREIRTLVEQLAALLAEGT